MRLLWLPDVLRDAGLTVHEVSGWRDRGSSQWGPVVGITCHHTAGSRTATPQAEINVLLHGSNTAPPPIAQLSLDRRGEWYVVASGLCYHNLVGWAGPNKGHGNGSLLGIEAMHSGGTEAWTPVQYESYARGVAALVRRLGISVSRVAGHKEHQPGSKFDPTFNMDAFRRDVREIIEGDDMPVTDADTIKIARAVHNQALGGSAVTIGQAIQSTHSIAVGLGARLADILTAVMSVDEAVAERIAEGADDVVVDTLRAALGDRAERIGRLLAGLDGA